MGSRPAMALLVGVLALGAARSARGWSNHAPITRAALAADRELAAAAPVRAETLDDFLASNGSGIASTLDEVEAWAGRAVPAYPPRPDDLRFEAAGDPATARARFLAAIRANPSAGAVLFVQVAAGTARGAPAHAELAERELVPEANLTDVPYRFAALRPGEAVLPLEVLAAASDEPDYGLDVGLFDDNGTAWGARYRWGPQSLGNKKLAYGSQAPFHMGFFHEAGIVYRLAGFLRRMFPEYRIGSFLALSRYAFATGHAYWGYRFLGWALHYVQDLTQPYHATALPGVGTLSILWNNTLALAGFTGGRDALVTRATNRHLVLENFQLHALAAALATGDPGSPLLAALADTAADAALGAFDDRSPREALSRAAWQQAAAVDAVVGSAVPARYVDDPGYTYSVDEPAVDVAALLRREPGAEQRLARALGELLRATGAWTRKAARSLRPRR